MKKIVIIAILVLGFIVQATAQQKARSKYMIVTLSYNNDNYRKISMIVTQEDTSPVKTKQGVDSGVKNKDLASAFEGLTLQLLKPYFDNGWKLVTSTVQVETFAYNSVNNITRFYLSKDE
jgi:hypothetical protein